MWLVLCLVLMLVSLPVLPLRQLGIPVPDFHLQNIAGLFAEKHPSEKHPAETPTPSPKKLVDKAKDPDRIAPLESAVVALSAKISAYPQDPSLHNQLGLVLLSLGELEKAGKQFEQAADLCQLKLEDLCRHQNQPDAGAKPEEGSQLVLESSRLNIELSAAHGNLARLYEKLGRHDKVVAELEQLNKDSMCDFCQSNKTALDGKAEPSPIIKRLLSNGETLMHSGRFEEAKTQFANAIAVDPSLALSHHYLGLNAALAHNSELAVKEFETACRLEPANAVVHNNLGLAYQAENKRAMAQCEFEKAVALDPKLTQAAINLGSIYSQQGNYAMAQQALEQAVKGNPKSAMAQNNLASALSMQGKYSQANDHFEQSLAIEPDMASSHYGLGLSLYSSGEYRRAIGEFKRALSLDPNLLGAQDKIELSSRKAAMTSGTAYGFN